MNEIKINLDQFAVVVIALLTVGAILKNAIPSFPNRLIPLVTLLLAIAAYQSLVNGWHDPRQWVAALVAAATATGFHSGLKNSSAKTDPPPE